MLTESGRMAHSGDSISIKALDFLVQTPLLIIFRRVAGELLRTLYKQTNKIHHLR